MDPVRAVVWDDVECGYVQVTQKGEVRAWEMRNDLKGPIRVRRGPKWDERDSKGYAAASDGSSLEDEKERNR